MHYAVQQRRSPFRSHDSLINLLSGLFSLWQVRRAPLRLFSKHESARSQVITRRSLIYGYAIMPLRICVSQTST